MLGASEMPKNELFVTSTTQQLNQLDPSFWLMVEKLYFVS